MTGQEPTPDEDRPSWMQGLDEDVARLEAERDREDPEVASQDEIDEAWRVEIERRAAELRADPSIGLTWDEAKARLASRREDQS